LSDQPGDLCKWIAPADGSEIVAWHRFALIQLGSWPLILSSKWMFDYIAFLGDLDSLWVATVGVDWRTHQGG
jgi:hypothetical protein